MLYQQHCLLCGSILFLFFTTVIESSLINNVSKNLYCFPKLSLSQNTLASVMHLMCLGPHTYWQSTRARLLPSRPFRQFYYLNWFCNLYSPVPFILPQQCPYEQLPQTVHISRGLCGVILLIFFLSSQEIKTRATVNYRFSAL